MRDYFDALRNGFVAAMVGRATVISFLIFYWWKVRRAGV